MVLDNTRAASVATRAPVACSTRVSYRFERHGVAQGSSTAPAVQPLALRALPR
jgi:hypothetical protein